MPADTDKALEVIVMTVNDPIFLPGKRGDLSIGGEVTRSARFL